MTAVPLVAALALAFLVGVLGESVRVDGTASLMAAVAVCAIAGASVAALMRGLKAVVLGSLAGTSVIPLTLALKYMRWPDEPLLGDAAGLVFVLAGAAAMVGALVGATVVHLRGVRV